MKSAERKLILVVLAGAALACQRSEAPKVPLGSEAAKAQEGQAMSGGLVGDARVALDSANVLFRKKAYNPALAQYERAAKLAPHELAPLLGVMMVADAINDRQLATMTLARIRKIDPSAADSALVMPHSKVIESHPRTSTDRTL